MDRGDIEEDIAPYLYSLTNSPSLSFFKSCLVLSSSLRFHLVSCLVLVVCFVLSCFALCCLVLL